MENEQQQASTTNVCRAGCGFYGSSATEGYCSKCFKDTLKRTQEPPVRLTSPVVSMAASSSALTLSPSSSPPSNVAIDLGSSSSSSETCAKAAFASAQVTAKLESDEALLAGLSAAEAESPESTAPMVIADVAPPVKKANRCGTCKKRVGLTGFSCRCGGLYCGEHRYDKAHNCQFDYKTMEREQIRKANPVVVSDKVQRI